MTQAKTKPLLMLDICAGLKGASQAMKRRGWQVITLDIEQQFETDIRADIRQVLWGGACPDLIWASPPCTEFARESMPWCKTGNPPDLSIVRACYRFIKHANPRYWVLENVRGAAQWIPQVTDHYAPCTIIGPFYLWGHFPPIDHVKLKHHRKKESYGSQRAAERARIPVEISEALAIAIEQQLQLWPHDPSQD